MKNLNIKSSPITEATENRFESIKALAFSIAESDLDLLEPALVAWLDCSTNNSSPVLEGCSGKDGCHDYGMSHGG